MSDTLEIRATDLPAVDLDYLRSHARRQGYPNTGSAVVRYAVIELARRLRDSDPATVRLTGAEDSHQPGSPE